DVRPAAAERDVPRAAGRLERASREVLLIEADTPEAEVERAAARAGRAAAAAAHAGAQGRLTAARALAADVQARLEQATSVEALLTEHRDALEGLDPAGRD